MQKQEVEHLLSTISMGVLKKLADKPDDIKTSEMIALVHQELGEILRNAEDEMELRTVRMLYEDEYKRLARESIESYASSNRQMNGINDEVVRKHQDSILAQHPSKIDLNDIAARFGDIQSHLETEIARANQTIHELMDRIQELEMRSSLDPLTKVYNRYALKQHLLELGTITDRQFEMHVLLLDIDDFKLVNDQHGHVAGDKILIFIAKILTKALRDGDRIYRYGGEEFLILLNRISDEECRTITERILNYIRTHHLLFKDQQITITASIGVTRYRSGDTLNSIVERADEALYKAKANGKDRMEVSD